MSLYVLTVCVRDCMTRSVWTATVGQAIHNEQRDRDNLQHRLFDAAGCDLGSDTKGKAQMEQPFTTSRNVSASTTGRISCARWRHVRRSKACRVLYWHGVIFNQLGHRGSRCGNRGRIVGPFCSWQLIHYFFFHTTTAASAFTEELSWKKSSCHRKLQWLLTPCFLQYWEWSLNETVNLTVLTCRNKILM